MCWTNTRGTPNRQTNTAELLPPVTFTSTPSRAAAIAPMEKRLMQTSLAKIVRFMIHRRLQQYQRKGLPARQVVDTLADAESRHRNADLVNPQPATVH